jgi:deoxyribonuclease-4
MIRFGPAGIPLSCKGRTLRDGLEDVHNLGLSALEVQLVRVNTQERPAGDEEDGRKVREIEGELVVEVRRRGMEAWRTGLDTVVEAGDTLVSLTSGVAADYRELEELGALARDLDIETTLHAPYYMDLADVDHLAAKSMDSVRWGGLLAEALRARAVSTHIGLYGELAPEEAFRRVAGNLRTVRDWFKALRLRPLLGVESSGQQEVLGSLDEILELARSVKGIVPVINFAHAHARSNGSLREAPDFDRLMEAIAKLTPDRHLHTHFSGVEHEGGNELRYTPIKKGDLRFEPLAEALLEDGWDVTLVSSSPLLEHDAMYMKVIYERILAKKLSRTIAPVVPEERPLIPQAPPPARPVPRAAAKPKPRPKARPKPRPRPKQKQKQKKKEKKKKARPGKGPKGKAKPRRRR